MTSRLADFNDIKATCVLYQKFYGYNEKQQPGYYRPVEEHGTYPESVIGGNSGDIYVVSVSPRMLPQF
ncbi:MAG: hypothetical protein ACK5L3_07990 [Oscillospiraceae bacterium]